MKKISLIAFIVTVAFISCKKEEPPVNDPVSIIPSIELRSVAPLTVTEYEDSIIFELFYTDGDGDLGFDSPDSLSLFITDPRIAATEGYYVQTLSPAGTAVAIQGVLQVKLDRTIMVDDTQPSEQVQFELVLKDRAGHYSNTVVSGPVTVLPD